MTEKEFSEGVPCAFLDEHGWHEGVTLGQQGDDYAWALIFDLKEVFEIFPGRMVAKDGLIIFRTYERRRTIQTVATESAIDGKQQPFFLSADRHNDMLAIVKTYFLLLGPEH